MFSCILCTSSSFQSRRSASVLLFDIENEKAQAKYRGGNEEKNMRMKNQS